MVRGGAWVLPWLLKTCPRELVPLRRWKIGLNCGGCCGESTLQWSLGRAVLFVGFFFLILRIRGNINSKINKIYSLEK